MEIQKTSNSQSNLDKEEWNWRNQPAWFQTIIQSYSHQEDFPGGSDGKASAYNVGDPGSIPVLERSSGEGNGNPLQYSSLENPMDRGAW